MVDTRCQIYQWSDFYIYSHEKVHSLLFSSLAANFETVVSLPFSPRLAPLCFALPSFPSFPPLTVYSSIPLPAFTSFFINFFPIAVNMQSYFHFRRTPWRSDVYVPRTVVPASVLPRGRRWLVCGLSGLPPHLHPDSIGRLPSSQVPSTATNELPFRARVSL